MPLVFVRDDFGNDGRAGGIALSMRTIQPLVVGLLLVSSLHEGVSQPSAPDLRRRIEQRVARSPKHRLSKAELRPRLKVVMRHLEPCYRDALATDPQTSGVVNTSLTIRSDPKLGISLTVTGFDTHGSLGTSKPFLACMKTTLEANVLPAIASLGTIDVIYPMTFDPGGGAHGDDQSIVDGAVRAASRGRCAEAFDGAERGLERSWLAGPLRHRLIEVAGACACRLKNEAKARHYFELASPEFEDNIVRACGEVDIELID